MRLGLIAGITCILVWSGAAFAQGLIIPNDTELPPLALRSHKVTAEVTHQGATTTVEQIFENNTDRQLEARYVFPLPRGASIRKFTMLVNGVEKSGELVEKNQARQIYQSIVSRAQDPGLLECIGRDLFQANIFPILPRSTQRITISYLQILTREGELVSYTYPMHAPDRRGPTVRNEFSLDVRIKSPSPIKSIYSPSHSILVTRPAETTAEIRFEKNQMALEKDFQLFYSVGEKDVGMDLVTYRPDPAKPGYFMLLVSPKSKLQEAEIVKRDLVFVVDSSHSMAGEKIGQAREALKFCVNHLNEGDRFNIVTFSTDVETWKKDLVDAGKSQRDAALSFIETIEPTGGTNIDEALKTAFSFQRRGEARPYIVVFMTDGKPTVGSTIDPKQILAHQLALTSDSARNVRLFTWGVGYDVDTHLLDLMAEHGSGVSEYVKPQEDIAAKVAAFYNKASKPALTGLQMEVLNEKIQLVNVYPKRMPDLYAGTQLVVCGQYIGDGPVALRLSGQVNERNEQFTYEMDFPKADKSHEFVESLWGKRRVGHLLDTIRLQGETKELVDDVIQLSKLYGIQTPYTSYLILEDGTPVPATDGKKEPQTSWNGAGRPPASAPAAMEKLHMLMEKEKKAETKDGAKYGGLSATEGSMAREAEEDRRARNELAADLSLGFRQSGDKAGVAVSEYVRRLKRADSADEGKRASFRMAGGQRFFAYRGAWVDERFEAAVKVTEVKFASPAYFLLLEKHPELLEVFKLGRSVLCSTAPGKAVLICAAGAENLTEDEIARLFEK